eukprot:SAG11_NODE_3672_length_2294_cov_3.504328_2_plen_42_part_00
MEVGTLTREPTAAAAPPRLVGPAGTAGAEVGPGAAASLPLP